MLFGSDAFSTFAIKGLLKARSKLDLSFQVFTTKPTSHRPHPFADFAEQNKVPLTFLDRLNDGNSVNFAPILELKNSQNQLNDQTDLTEKTQNEIEQVMMACSFGYMVPSEVIDLFSKSFVVHPSLLPRYRGSSPISAALLKGDSETGTSIVGMSRGKFDAGPIFAQKSCPIPPHFLYSDLWEKLGCLSEELVYEFFENYEAALKNPTPQGKGTSAPRLKQGDADVSFVHEDAQKIHRKFRAYTGSTLKKICLFFGDKQEKFFVDQLEIFSDDEFLPEIGLRLNAILPPGFAFRGPGDLKKYLVVKAKSGFVIIKSGHFDKKSPAAMNLIMKRFCSEELSKLIVNAIKNPSTFDEEKASQLIQVAPKFN